MAEFKPGEIVRILIEDARVEETLTEGHDADVTQVLRVAITGRHGGTYYTTLPLDWANAVVARVAPAEWPPQRGDLWKEVDGALWFAQSLGGSQMGLIPAQPRGVIDAAMLPAYVLETFGPLSLVYRETGPEVAE